jgi:hypothetical protein
MDVLARSPCGGVESMIGGHFHPVCPVCLCYGSGIVGNPRPTLRTRDRHRPPPFRAPQLGSHRPTHPIGPRAFTYTRRPSSWTNTVSICSPRPRRSGAAHRGLPMARLTQIRRGWADRHADLGPDEWFIPDLARQLGAAYSTIYGWLKSGLVAARQQHGKQGCWVVQVDPQRLHDLTAYKRRRTSQKPTHDPMVEEAKV